MKILVTGGAGYIGTHTCVLLLEHGFDMVVVDSLVNSSARALKRVEEITGHEIPFYRLDVCDASALSQVFQEHAFNCVVHFAGLKSVGESVRNPLLYYENNLLSTITLLKVMSAHAVKRLVFPPQPWYIVGMRPCQWMSARLVDVRILTDGQNSCVNRFLRMLHAPMISYRRCYCDI